MVDQAAGPTEVLGRAEFVLGQYAYGAASYLSLTAAGIAWHDKSVVLLTAAGSGFAAAAYKMKVLSDQGSIGLGVSVGLSWALPIVAAFALAYRG